jgi:pimeloyl-ACP methyl ester carboxylesterase
VIERGQGTHPIDLILLPGIITPAAIRFRPLVEALGPSVRALTKELEVYARDTPPAGYSIAGEVEAVSRFADGAGLTRFHLYGYSGGGAVALAYAAERPERLLSLALQEPATDFSVEDKAWTEQDFGPLASLSGEQRMSAFLRLQLAPNVEPPPRLSEPPPPWMALRPAGVEAFLSAIRSYSLPAESLASFEKPVYYSYGNLSHPRWLAIRDRLASRLPNFRAELYKGTHHLNPPDQAEPERVAAALRALWG